MRSPQRSNETDKLWTIMVYLAGDNNLSSEMIYTIKEMKRAKRLGAKGEITVLVLFDPPHGLPAQGYLISSGDKDNQLSQEAVMIGVRKIKERGRIIKSLSIIDSPNSTFEPINTGEPEPLLQFINYGLDNHKAQHYMVILSGHGSGADQDFFLKDEGARDSLTIRELKQVFTTVKTKLNKEQPGRNIDILGLDSCLMSMAEVYYALANIEAPENSDEPSTTGLGNLVEFIVGAEGFELNTGWPYERVLSALTKKPQLSPQELAEKIVNTYILYYSDFALSGLSVDLAACDLRANRANRLKDGVFELASTLKNLLKEKSVQDAIILAHWEAQSYKFDQYTDLLDFCQLIAERCGNKYEEIDKAYKKIKSAIEDGDRIVRISSHSGPAVQYSYGLSVYFPWNRVSSHYKQLDFARGTGWGEFLDEYVQATRRLPRCRPDLSAASPIEHRLFKPRPERTSQPVAETLPSGEKFTLPENRFTLPENRFTLPENMGVIGVTESMKNPPIEWFPVNRVKKKAKPPKAASVPAQPVKKKKK